MYIYIYIYICIYIQTHTHIYIYVHILILTEICIYAYTHILTRCKCCRWILALVCVSVSVCMCIYMLVCLYFPLSPSPPDSLSLLHSFALCLYVRVWQPTGWRRFIGCVKLQVVFYKRAINYRALLRKMTYKDKPSYASSPPCTKGEEAAHKRLRTLNPPPPSDLAVTNKTLTSYKTDLHIQKRNQQRGREHIRTDTDTHQNTHKIYKLSHTQTHTHVHTLTRIHSHSCKGRGGCSKTWI